MKERETGRILHLSFFPHSFLLCSGLNTELLLVVLSWKVREFSGGTWVEEVATEGLHDDVCLPGLPRSECENSLPGLTAKPHAPSSTTSPM